MSAILPTTKHRCARCRRYFDGVNSTRIEDRFCSPGCYTFAFRLGLTGERRCGLNGCPAKLVYKGHGRAPQYCSQVHRNKANALRVDPAPALRLVVAEPEYLQLPVGTCPRCGVENWLYADTRTPEKAACGTCTTTIDLARFPNRSAA